MVPGIDDYSELILGDSMNIDSLKWKGAKLRASFGGGYGAFAVVDAPHGLHRWSLSAGVLPADDDYGNLVNNTNRFDYYFDFFRDHTTGDQEIFWITFRGKKYHCAFTEPEISYERFSEDLFAGGVEIEQRKVPGVYYRTDGSIFDPADLSPWGWYDGASFQYLSNSVTDLSGNGHNLEILSDVIGATYGDYDIARFNSVVTPIADVPGIGGAHTPDDPDVPTGGGYIRSTLTPVIKEALFVMKMREALFSNYAGLLTADVTIGALVGNSGDTKLNNFAFGGSYSYKKNQTTFAEANQQAPMNTWAVIHARWSNGISLHKLQIGRDRDFPGRYSKMDWGEGILSETAWTTDEAYDARGYAMRKWGILA